MKIEPLHIPLQFRPIDFILLGLIAIQFFWQAISYAEITDLRAMIEMIETKGQP